MPDSVTSSSSPGASSGSLVLRFTPTARETILRMRKELNVPEDYFVRVGVNGLAAGCGIGNMSYILGFDAQKEGDRKYEIEGIPVVMDVRHSLHLLGMEIDYVEEEGKSGFMFTNPAARKAENEE